MCYDDEMEKHRLTITVDSDLSSEAEAAVSAGRVRSVSAWVNEAMREHAEREHRHRALGEAIADYEAEFGEITEEEVKAAERKAKADARVVRGRGSLRRNSQREA